MRLTTTLVSLGDFFWTGGSCAFPLGGFSPPFLAILALLLIRFSWKSDAKTLIHFCLTFDRQLKLQLQLKPQNYNTKTLNEIDIVLQMSFE